MNEPVSEKYQTQSSLKSSCLPEEMTQWVKKALVKVAEPELDPQNPHKRTDTSTNETKGRNYWLPGVHWPPSQTRSMRDTMANKSVRHPKNKAQGCPLASASIYIYTPHTQTSIHTNTHFPLRYVTVTLS